MTYVLLIAVALLVFAGVIFLRRRAPAGGQANRFTNDGDPHLHRNQNDVATGAMVGGLVANDSLQNQSGGDSGGWGTMSGSSGSFDSGSSGSFDGGSTSVD